MIGLDDGVEIVSTYSQRGGIRAAECEAALAWHFPFFPFSLCVYTLRRYCLALS